MPSTMIHCARASPGTQPYGGDRLDNAASSRQTAPNDSQNPALSGASGCTMRTMIAARPSHRPGATARPAANASIAQPAIAPARTAGVPAPESQTKAATAPRETAAATRPSGTRVSHQGTARPRPRPTSRPNTATSPTCNPDTTRRCTVPVRRNSAQSSSSRWLPSPVASASRCARLRKRRTCSATAPRTRSSVVGSKCPRRSPWRT